MAKGLTRKQEVFVAEYLTDLNSGRAAIAAGYSEKSAQSLASQLLANPKVSAQIAAKTQKRLTKLDISAERVLQELAKLAFFDIRKFYNADGSLKAIPDLDDETAAALVGMEVEEVYTNFGGGKAKLDPGKLLKKIKMADKGLNLERLGKHLKLFTDRVEVDISPTMADLIRKVRERKAQHESAQTEPIS